MCLNGRSVLIYLHPKGNIKHCRTCLLYLWWKHRVIVSSLPVCCPHLIEYRLKIFLYVETTISIQNVLCMPRSDGITYLSSLWMANPSIWFQKTVPWVRPSKFEDVTIGIHRINRFFRYKAAITMVYRLRSRIKVYKSNTIYAKNDTCSATAGWERSCCHLLVRIDTSLRSIW